MEDQIKIYFDNHPDKDACFSSSDGFIFHEQHNADAYGSITKNVKIKKHTRQAVEAKMLLSKKSSEGETGGSETETDLEEDAAVDGVFAITADSEVETASSETETIASETKEVEAPVEKTGKKNDKKKTKKTNA